MTDPKELRWTLSTEGSLEELRSFLEGSAPKGETRLAFSKGMTEAPAALNAHADLLSKIPSPYSWRDVSAFAPSGAVYFMDGYSDARIRLLASGEEINLTFWDKNTSIAASAPHVYSASKHDMAHFTPVPPPLHHEAIFPENVPDHYRRETSYHLMQVISMNMKAKDSEARLLIGLPYAEKYPELFFRNDLLGITRRDATAASYGVVQSLTAFAESNGDKTPRTNGYPARSFFAIYHLIETPIGALFNKKATQMELQPSADGKLATTLPPLPFRYSLINAPIPLFLATDPDGEPIGELLSATHHDGGSAVAATDDAWPWHVQNLEHIANVRNELKAR